MLSLLIVALFAGCQFSFSQDFILPLYNDKIPNSINTGQKEKIEKSDITLISNVQNPDIAVYLPSKRFATGQAVVICPGGGYWVLAYDLEGTDMARYLNSIGVVGIVLKYRLPTSGNTVESHKVPLMDAQRAMRLVRSNAKSWNIDTTKIGIMGFSAGGHLASTLGTHFDYGNKAATDSVERRSCRPDFMVLMYPVISFTDSCMHSGSEEALLGKNASHDLKVLFSNELQVKEDTPPAFICQADNDTGVPTENSILMYRALKKKKIPAELHILSEGEHGFGLGVNNDHVASWTNSLQLWLNWLNKIK
ncbi:MAG TPA: alpha/beta hydrolase [Prolixibacteraceae bacterium]|nr:alpha/beta hydrolase [Prolixibacteraceae bacterium]